MIVYLNLNRIVYNMSSDQNEIVINTDIFRSHCLAMKSKWEVRVLLTIVYIIPLFLVDVHTYFNYSNTHSYSYLFNVYKIY